VIDKEVKRLTKRQQNKVVKWLPDAYNIAFDKNRTNRLSPEQVVDRKRVAEDALMAAVLEWRSDKGTTFRTYLWRKIQWAILDAHRRSKQRRNQQITFTDLDSEDD
jgi:DNA-directed RNA polymerase specialized sigma24 family protein